MEHMNRVRNLADGALQIRKLILESLHVRDREVFIASDGLLLRFAKYKGKKYPVAARLLSTDTSPPPPEDEAPVPSNGAAS